MGFFLGSNEQHITLPSSSYPDSPVLSKRMRRGPRLLLPVLVSCLLLIIFFWENGPLGSGPQLIGAARIFNSTLGFEKIYAISMPERTDKRDALVMAASVTGLDFEWSEGVKFEDIPKKAAPSTWSFDTQSEGALGCWRAHMNVLQKIVKDKVQSALIMEDDADWDPTLKQQLTEFAVGARILQNDTTDGHALSPYGDSWDFLWIGNCKIGPQDDQTTFYVIENDPTVPPVSKRRGMWFNNHIPEEVLRNDTRLVFNARNGGTCLYSYAITYNGARKVLSSMSLTSQDDAVDLAYRYMCRGALGQEFNCLGVYPTLVGSHRFAGPKSRDSDLNNKSDRWHEEYTYDVPYSTVQNIPRIMANAELIQPQWPEEPSTQERRFADTLSLNGYTKQIDLKAMEKVQLKGVNVS